MQAALDKAERKHAKTAAAIQAAAEGLEKRSQAEDARWAEEKDRLQAVLRRERGWILAGARLEPDCLLWPNSRQSSRLNGPRDV